MLSAWYAALAAAVAADRLGEFAYSRRNQRRLAERGARPVRDPVFAGMVLLQVSYLCGAPLEVVLLHRRFLPWLGFPALAVLIAANALRVWAMLALSVHWNMQIMASQSLGAASSGPYRWIRHPNYVAIFLEVAALPLAHTAWLTATVATMAHIALLKRRIAAEEEVLMSDPGYVRQMGGKPRFIPFLV
ncbi:MAG TPA: isoprenylcysteine carboxylmethyltransferase family protein [Bryobacteraceae bacterium]|nr:isoprenylcysteine carboxylmethyltransferase family protein [Bryobacteraceae bacterium]